MTFIKPFTLPIFSFALAIFIGGAFLCLPISLNGEVNYLDSFFIATSAVCVTGLAPFDVFEVYNRLGQSVVLALMQLGALGIITFTTLIAWLAFKKIPLGDRVAVEQGLFYNPEFSLAAFIKRTLYIVFAIEALGAAAIFILYGDRINLFNAVFLSVSAFCNAGFAPWADSLEGFRQDCAFNFIMMALIVLGGLGFFVLDECLKNFGLAMKKLFSRKGEYIPIQLSYYSRLVIQTSIWFVLAGFFCIFIMGCFNPAFSQFTLAERIFAAFFESITSRTAGFATVNQGQCSSATLFFVVFLMFVGGSPCSSAGGVKTTTFRVLLASLVAKLRGRDQAVANGRAFDKATVGKAFLLFFCAVFIIATASFLLVFLEQGAAPHQEAPPFFDIFFETVSAFCTVGLSINLTGELCGASKVVLCILMFVGKLGPIWLITALSHMQSPISYKYPEENVPIG